MKTLWKSYSSYRTVTLQSECFSGLHHSRATAHTFQLFDPLKPSDYTVAPVTNRRTAERPVVFQATKQLLSALLLACGCISLAALTASAQATRPTNTVAADATSIAAGKRLFGSNCASCHGETGQGDGKAGSQLSPKPASLVDATWIHGASDGEIFTVIRDGVKDTGMKAFGSSMTAHQIWDVVNFLRSIGPDSPGTPP